MYNPQDLPHVCWVVHKSSWLQVPMYIIYVIRLYDISDVPTLRPCLRSTPYKFGDPAYDRADGVGGGVR